MGEQTVEEMFEENTGKEPVKLRQKGEMKMFIKVLTAGIFCSDNTL